MASPTKQEKAMFGREQPKTGTNGVFARPIGQPYGPTVSPNCSSFLFPNKTLQLDKRHSQFINGRRESDAGLFDPADAVNSPSFAFDGLAMNANDSPFGQSEANQPSTMLNQLRLREVNQANVFSIPSNRSDPPISLENQHALTFSGYQQHQAATKTAFPSIPFLSSPIPPSAPTLAEKRGFIPMLTVARPDKTGRDLTPATDATDSLRFSPRYCGMHTENNASADNLPTQQNCALWLTNLPPDVTERELLSSIRNVGRIYATYINHPDYVAHQTAAAKLVFFAPEAAQRLLSHSLTNAIFVRDYRIKVAPNRIKYARNSMDKGESRVLIVTGSEAFVNEKSLTEYFGKRFAFQVDGVRMLIRANGRAVVEYKFGSYRCQAQMGMKALLLDRPEGFEMVEFGLDPCEVGSELTSFTVAAERIQQRTQER